jgi:hypothetical protein
MLGRLKSLTSDMTTGMCCFCGESIRGEPHQDIVLPCSDGSTQHLIAHGNCLLAKLHPDVPYLTPKETQDDA